MMTDEITPMTDAEAEEVLRQYHHLVMHLAGKACHSSSSIDINDLYQVGDMAVLRAVKSYDPSSGSNIKSFVSNAIRNAVFNEAAKFLGAITVDFRTTSQAAYATKQHDNGKSDQEIAKLLTKKYGRNFNEEHVRDLRITYSRKQYFTIQDDTLVEDTGSEICIHDLLESVVRDDVDRVLMDKRILGKATIKEVAALLNISRKIAYERESLLKNRIKRAIEESV